MRTPCCPTREALQKIIDERAVADSDPGASLDLMRDYAERTLEFPCPCQRLAKLEEVAKAARCLDKVTTDTAFDSPLMWAAVKQVKDTLAALDQEPG